MLPWDVATGYELEEVQVGPVCTAPPTPTLSEHTASTTTVPALLGSGSPSAFAFFRLQAQGGHDQVPGRTQHRLCTVGAVAGLESSAAVHPPPPPMPSKSGFVFPSLVSSEKSNLQ